MPIVRVEYEKEKFSESDIRIIADAMQGFAAEVTNYEPKDISVFASANEIAVNAAPIEIYIYATFPTVTETDMETMLARLEPLIQGLKKSMSCTVPFNLSVVKMNWKFKLEV